jgi:hypothetical protein
MYAFGYPGHGGATTWVGSVKVDAPDQEAEKWRITKERFDALDLTRIDELKNEYPRADETTVGQILPPGSRAFVVKEGDILVGAFEMRDPRTNRPVDIAFKALVEKLRPAEPVEAP